MWIQTSCIYAKQQKNKQTKLFYFHRHSMVWRKNNHTLKRGEQVGSSKTIYTLEINELKATL